VQQASGIVEDEKQHQQHSDKKEQSSCKISPQSMQLATQLQAFQRHQAMYSQSVATIARCGRAPLATTA
jgi:hypothetical protein